MRETNQYFYDKSLTKNIFVYIYIGTKPHYFCQCDSNQLLTHTLGFLSHKWSLDLSGGIAFLRLDPSQRPKLSTLISVLLTDLTPAPSPTTLPQIPSFWIHGCCLSQLGLQEKIRQGDLTLQTGTHVTETCTHVQWRPHCQGKKGKENLWCWR